MNETQLKPSVSTADNDTSLLLADSNLEWCIIAHLLLAPFGVQQATWEHYRPDCFFYKITMNLYRCIGYMVEKGDTADQTNIAYMAMQRKICEPYELVKNIDQFIANELSFSELKERFEILEDYAKRRKIFEISQVLRKEGLKAGEEIDAVVERVKDALTEVVNGSMVKHTVNMQEVLTSMVNIVNANQSEQTKKDTTYCGFRYIDDKGGLVPSDLIIIAGNTSMGKTSLANSMVLNVITNAKVLYFTFEMSNEQLVSRMLSNKTKIASQRQLYSKLSADEVRTFDKGVNELWQSSQNLYFAGSEVINIDDICASIRKHKAKYDIKGVVIDYIQLIGGATRDENNERFLGRVARQLKNIAKSLNIWVIALSQLNRSNTDYVPSIRYIRGSGQIEEAADSIYLVYRPEYYNKYEGKSLTYPAPYTNVSTDGTAMIIQDKGRNNGVGSFICGFDAPTTSFYDIVGALPTTSNNKQEAQKGKGLKQPTDLEVPF